jgi:hypothetical protein
VEPLFLRTFLESCLSLLDTEVQSKQTALQAAGIPDVPRASSEEAVAGGAPAATSAAASGGDDDGLQAEEDSLQVVQDQDNEGNQVLYQNYDSLSF